MDTQELNLELQAEELKLDGFAEDRSLVCIAKFVDGFASGWFFAVREINQDALDTKLTERVFNGPKDAVWTQGKYYNFKPGDVFYDVRDAYGLAWGEALKLIRFCVQVQSATPSSIVKTKGYRTKDPVCVFEDFNDKSKTEKSTGAKLYKLIYTRNRMSFGSVAFSLFRPNKHTGELAEYSYKTDQESFVVFLQTGVLRTNDGVKLDLSSEANGEMQS